MSSLIKNLLIKLVKVLIWAGICSLKWEQTIFALSYRKIKTLVNFATLVNELKMLNTECYNLFRIYKKKIFHPYRQTKFLHDTSYLKRHKNRSQLRPCLLKTQNAKFYKSLSWYTKCSRKINRITQMDCKSRDESNEPNQNVIQTLNCYNKHTLMIN